MRLRTLYMIAGVALTLTLLRPNPIGVLGCCVMAWCLGGIEKDGAS